MRKVDDQHYLLTQQYGTTKNLNARIALHQQFSRAAVNWYTWMKAHFKLCNGQKAIELGAGNAMQWRINRLDYPKKSQITLTDFSMAMLREAEAALTGDDRFCCMVCDAQNISLADAQFDWVAANHMLYHVPNIDKAVAECARIVKGDGVFIASTNGCKHMRDIDALVRQFEPAYKADLLPHDRFSLQNGAGFLAPHFVDVHLDIFYDDLWITQPAPLVNYIFSIEDAAAMIGEQRRQALTNNFDQMIKSQGGILIRKETGVFLASHRRGLIQSLGILQAEQKLT